MKALLHTISAVVLGVSLSPASVTAGEYDRSGTLEGVLGDSADTVETVRRDGVLQRRHWDTQVFHNLSSQHDYQFVAYSREFAPVMRLEVQSRSPRDPRYVDVKTVEGDLAFDPQRRLYYSILNYRPMSGENTVRFQMTSEEFAAEDEKPQQRKFMVRWVRKPVPRAPFSLTDVLTHIQDSRRSDQGAGSVAPYTP